MICSCDKPGDCLLISKSNIHHPREVAVYSAQPHRYQIYVKYTAGDFDHGGVHAVHVEGCIVCIIIKGSLKKIGQSWDFVPTSLTHPPPTPSFPERWDFQKGNLPFLAFRFGDQNMEFGQNFGIWSKIWILVVRAKGFQVQNHCMFSQWPGYPGTICPPP